MSAFDDILLGSDALGETSERVAAELLASGADPGGVVLAELSPIKDQGSVAGLCPSCALTTAIEHSMQAGVQLSETFLDYLTRRDRGDFSGGAMVGEVARTVGRYGICQRALYADGEPSSAAFEDAARRIVTVVPFLRPGEPAADEVVAHLQAGRKIPVGLPIERRFLDYRPSGDWTPLGRFREGRVFEAPEHIVDDHAACICGWRRRDDAFLIQSSWGKSWGMGGYAWISRPYLTMWGVAGFCYVVAP